MLMQVRNGGMGKSATARSTQQSQKGISQDWFTRLMLRQSILVWFSCPVCTKGSRNNSRSLSESKFWGALIELEKGEEREENFFSSFLPFPWKLHKGGVKSASLAGSEGRKEGDKRGERERREGRKGWASWAVGLVAFDEEKGERLGWVLNKRQKPSYRVRANLSFLLLLLLPLIKFPNSSLKMLSHTLA